MVKFFNLCDECNSNPCQCSDPLIAAIVFSQNSEVTGPDLHLLGFMHPSLKVRICYHQESTFELSARDALEKVLRKWRKQNLAPESVTLIASEEELQEMGLIWPK